MTHNWHRDYRRAIAPRWGWSDILGTLLFVGVLVVMCAAAGFVE